MGIKYFCKRFFWRFLAGFLKQKIFLLDDLTANHAKGR
jgi:hypothetical protein